jgi:integrase/recombinase XerD
MPASSRPSRSNTAADSIARFTPITNRLRITVACDYPALGVTNPAHAYLDALEADDSKKSQGYALDILAAFLSSGTLSRNEIPWHELTPAHRDAVRAHLIERYTERSSSRRRPRVNAASVNPRIFAWRKVLWHARDQGLATGEDQRRTADMMPVKGERKARRKFVPDTSLAAIFQCCALDPNRAAGTRDAAILALYFGCGLRRFEAIQLLLSDIEMRDDGWLVTVIGKRNKQRIVGVPIGAAAFMKDWLELRGREPGPLFYPVRKNGVIDVREVPMTSRVGNTIVEKRLSAAGVPKFSPHDLRATSTTILAGLLTAFQTMEWAGHEDPNTTREYVAEANHLAREIADKLHVPYARDVSWRDLARES